MTCICGEPNLVLKKYSENFDQKTCFNCGSACFVAKEGVNWFNYDSDNDKYSDQDYLSHGEFRWAHAEILNLLKNECGSYLEIGTFNGFFANQLAFESKLDVYGEDMNSEAIRVGKGLYSKIADKLGLVNQFEKIQFDGIILIDVFEHVEDPRSFVENVSKRLKSGGKIYLSGPTIERLFHDRSDMPPHHPWRYSSKGMIKFFESSGFKIVERKIEYNGPLLLRNIIGLFISGFPKEFNGEGLNLKPKSKKTVLNKLLNFLGLPVSFLLGLLRIQYCSQLMVYEKV